MALLHLLFLLLLHSLSAEAEQIPLCEGGNFTANSTFGSNLNLLLSNLSSSNATFFTAIKGASPNRVYGLVLCRGDQDPSSCTTCYKMLSHNVTQLCTHSKQATVWDRNCELRYSNISFFNSIDKPEDFEGFCNTQNLSDTFANMSRVLFKNTSYQAANNSSRMFATGMLSYSESPIYSLAQCTMDLSSDLCSQCLQQILDFYWKCCSSKIGGWFLAKSCNYRYKVSQFYSGNTTLVVTLPPPSPPPSPPPPPTPLVSPPTSGQAATQNRGG